MGFILILDQKGQLDNETINYNKNISDFFQKIVYNNLDINDYVKINGFVEQINKGELDPMNKLNDLISIRNEILSFDYPITSNNFKKDLKIDLDAILNMLNQTDLNNFDKDCFNKLISNIEKKAEIKSDEEYIDKMIEYKRLLHMYGGPNLETFNFAKDIDNKDIKISEEYIAKLKLELNMVYEEIMLMPIDNNIKEIMIGKFNNMYVTCDKYSAVLINHNKSRQKYESLLDDLGLKINSNSISFKKEENFSTLDNHVPIENNVPSSTNDLFKVVLISDGNLDYKKITQKLLVLAGLALQTSKNIKPEALLSAILWAYYEYEDQIDLKAKNKYFNYIINNIENILDLNKINEVKEDDKGMGL